MVILMRGGERINQDQDQGQGRCVVSRVSSCPPRINQEQGQGQGQGWVWVGEYHTRRYHSSLQKC